MNKLREIAGGIRQSGKMKYYILVVLLGYGGYIWSEMNGYRFLGDGVDSREQHSAFSHSSSHRSHHFYHK